MPTAEWASRYLRLPDSQADVPGEYSPHYAPYLLGVFHSLDSDDPETVCMKAAQIGWTFGLLAYLGQRIDRDPCAMVGLFSGEEAAKEFVDEKLVPVIEATPVLAGKVDTSRARKTGNRALYKQFPGGFLKLGGSRSVHKVKSTPAALVLVEEPDDAKENLRDQGDAIKLLWERAKRFRRGKRILGGTPSLKGLSRVEAHLERSDKRVLPIRCHACGEAHVLSWDNVSWLDAEEGPEHAVYGRARPETALYVCPACGDGWGDAQRKANIRATVFEARDAGDPWCGWTPTADYHGVRGFHELGEVYSCLPGVGLAELVRDYLEAQHRRGQGDENAWIVFVNSKLGRPYEFQGDEIQAETLAERGEAYPEWVIPSGGLLVTVGIDVQHDRLYVVFRAWGRGAESWLLWFGEVPAEKTTLDKTDRCWTDLDDLVFRQIRSADGWVTSAAAVSIDSSDGYTSEAVYDWVRTRNRKRGRVHVMAIKGDANRIDAEPFRTPSKRIDHRRPDRQTKADRHGVLVYLVGTHKAKDWLDGHIRLTGAGPGRWHWYSGVRPEYLEHLTAEVRAPHRHYGGRKVWQLKVGRENHGLDCEVYALHAAWSQQVHTKTDAKWAELETALRQPDLFGQETAPAAIAGLQARPDAPAEQVPATLAPGRDLAALARQLNG
jgi:phage terminase large subunit GpA-like protein